MCWTNTLRWKPWYQGTRAPQRWNLVPGHFFGGEFIFCSKKNMKKNIFFLSLSLFSLFLCTHTLDSFEFTQFHQSKLWRKSQKRCYIQIIGTYTCLEQFVETWVISIGTCSNEIHRSVGTTSHQRQVAFCRCVSGFLTELPKKRFRFRGPHDVSSDSLYGVKVLSLLVTFPMLWSIWHSTLNLIYRYMSQ